MVSLTPCIEHLTLNLQFIAVVLILTLAACKTTLTDHTSYNGTVSKVHDGDSIHITPAGQKRVIIRLAGIDAPELKQPFGIRSRDKLRSMILDRQASANCHKVDRYQRQVCVVLFNGRDINLEMVKAGLAWHYKKYQSEQTKNQQRQYRRAEKQASDNRAGLWSSDSSIPPWDYRASK